MSVRGSFALGVAWSLTWLPACEASIDQNGNGVSDLWEQMNPGLGVNADSDGDGQSNGEESVAGTDPLDRDSRLEVRSLDLDSESGKVNFQWNALAGRNYSVEVWDEVEGLWQHHEDLAVPGDGLRSHSFDRVADRMIFRLRATEKDEDGDGLTAWEESLFGLDDGELRSGPDSTRTDFAHALRGLEGSGMLTLEDGSEVPRRMPQKDEVARFLVQSTFGPSPEEIDQVTALGIGPWLDQQFLEDPTVTQDVMWENGQLGSVFLWRQGWWRAMMLGEDQLRQRMAFALSQILVVNCDTGSYPGDNPIIQAIHYDLYGKYAFGNYRGLLEDITYSPVMGFYLSHLRNRKSDPALDRYPDENFAREIMQLFTVGLWQLNPDGSRVIDGSGAFVPSYDNGVITEMAKIFTGFSFSTMNRGADPSTGFFQGGNGQDYYYPMKVWDTEHEPGPKTIIGGVEIPAGQTGDEDVDAALDALCAHPSMAPFLCRLLIQRFTSSNPSPGYIERVSTVWQDNGAGESGDLKAVIEAILLDVEARTPEGESSDDFGKVREPLLRVTSLMRAFDASNSSGTYPNRFVSSPMIGEVGQFPMLAPSVFNFYSPDHQPAGELRSRNLVSPELELATTSRMILFDNLLREIVDIGWASLQLDTSQEVAIADDLEALMDHLDLLLCWGRLSDDSRATITQALVLEDDPEKRVEAAIHLIVESPDCAVLK